MSRLLVFLHLAVKQRALQQELQAALETLQVTAVGRVPDLDRAFAQGQDAVLTYSPVLNARGLTPKLTGYRRGRPDETYSLVSVNSPADPSRLAGIGALDLLGREGTTAFVQQLTASNAKVERVTKIEDLLPLLQLQRVDAILLPSRLVPDLQAVSEMKLVARELERRVGLPAVAVLSPEGNRAVNAVARLSPRMSQRLGVDEWR